MQSLYMLVQDIIAFKTKRSIYEHALSKSVLLLTLSRALRLIAIERPAHGARRDQLTHFQCREIGDDVLEQRWRCCGRR